MKKLMFGMAAALALCGMADIESSNTVGYQTKDVEAGKFSIAAVQFEATDGTTDINKLVTGLTGVSYAEYGADFVSVAPHIQVPNAKGTYDLYYYLTDGFYIDENGNEAEKPGWCDLAGTIAGDIDAGALVSGELTAGVAIWVKDPSASEALTTAGQVPTVDNVSVTAPTIFALRANAYPVAFNLNDSSMVEFEGLTPGSYATDGQDFVQTAPHIQVPNAKGTYDLYYYLTDGFYIDANGNEAEKPGWCDLAGTIAGDDEAGALVSGDVPAGFGFWTKGVGSAFTLKFKK